MRLFSTFKTCAFLFLAGLALRATSGLAKAGDVCTDYATAVDIQQDTIYTDYSNGYTVFCAGGTDPLEISGWALGSGWPFQPELYDYFYVNYMIQYIYPLEFVDDANVGWEGASIYYDVADPFGNHFIIIEGWWTPQ